MAYSNPDDVKYGERCRITVEGGLLITEEVTFERGVRFRDILTIENAEQVWIQSIHPDVVRKRITGDYPNPDAVLLQKKVDAAEAENRKLRERIENMENAYSGSQELWKSKHRNKRWMTDARLENLAATLERGEPEPDWD